MFSFHKLQNNNKETIVFLHGLHTNAGFWLPALANFKGFRIILININYEIFFSSSDPFADFDNYLIRNEDVYGSKHILIGHSFGAVLAAKSLLHFRRRIYVAPVFSATPKDINAFGLEVAQRLGCDSTAASCIEKSKRALSIAQQVDVGELMMRGDIFMLPDADKYFDYHRLPSGPSVVSYAGDHFQINIPFENYKI